MNFNTTQMEPLGKLCQTSTGGTPSRTNPAYFGGDIPWVKCGDLPDGIITNTDECITKEAVANSSAKILPKGTLLIALYAGETIGRLGILDMEACTNQAICAITPPQEIDTKFLFWYLMSIRQHLRDQAVGGVQLNINQGVLRETKIPTIPLKKQKEIVARIEALFGRLDSVAKTTDIIKRVATICFDKFLSSAFSDSKAQKMTMGDISSIVGGSTPKTGDIKNYQNGSIAWITPADLSKYKDKYIAYGKRNITQQGLNSSSVHMLPKGAILFSSRAPIGYVAIATNDLCTNQGFKNFILSDKILPEYAYWWLKSIKNLAISMGSGTTFAELSKTSAQNLPFLYVPMKRQKEIVGRIEKIFSRLSFLSNRTHNMDNLMQQCRGSILSVEFAYNQRR